MAISAKLPSRLHHTAYTSKDLEATRHFYEDIIGLPLIATWCEKDELFGKERTYCHCFFGLGDGGALMGGIASLADKLPAQITQMANAAPDLQEKALKRTEGIINAMTPAERRKPELLKASRKRRIAAGAGVQVQEVNRLLAQFENMQKMMKMMRGGNLGKMLRNMKGMFPGGR